MPRLSPRPPDHSRPPPPLPAAGAPVPRSQLPPRPTRQTIRTPAWTVWGARRRCGAGVPASAPPPWPRPTVAPPAPAPATFRDEPHLTSRPPALVECVSADAVDSTGVGGDRQHALCSDVRELEARCQRDAAVVVQQRRRRVEELDPRYCRAPPSLQLQPLVDAVPASAGAAPRRSRERVSAAQHPLQFWQHLRYVCQFTHH
eukprot:6203225-Pleurochrysis_carterae.AAC.3